jgi:hypothetical protein
MDITNGGGFTMRWRNDNVLDVDGSVATNIRTITVSVLHTDIAGDSTLLCDASGGAITVNLPSAASSTGRVLVVKKIDSSGNAVTIDANGGETIDGATTQAISAQWASLTIQSDGSGWYIL